MIVMKNVPRWMGEMPEKRWREKKREKRKQDKNATYNITRILSTSKVPADGNIFICINAYFKTFNIFRSLSFSSCVPLILSLFKRNSLRLYLDFDLFEFSICTHCKPLSSTCMSGNVRQRSTERNTKWREKKNMYPSLIACTSRFVLTHTHIINRIEMHNQPTKIITTQIVELNFKVLFTIKCG